MPELPERVRSLFVRLDGQACGDLVHQSQIVFKYRRDEPGQLPVGLLMPASRLVYQSNAMFPVMDQNLPEGYLFERLRQLYPKQPLSAMHLLALSGDNGIGRLGFALSDEAATGAMAPRPMAREELLALAFTPEVFDELVAAYLSTGVGVSGMQPKVMVPDRASISIPNLIVKAGSDAYPGLAANEYLCLRAARAAGILVPDCELSNDGQLLVIDRFDLTGNGHRIGFEDIAALMGLRVRDTLSDRKYQRSYEDIADVLKALNLGAHDLARFYEQVAFSVMVRNGDGHLKNFGVCYTDASDARLSPMFDVVTKAIYKYARLSGGPDLEDKTMALKLFRGKGHSRAYPTTDELLRFGRQVCGVGRPAAAISRIAGAMADTLQRYRSDERMPPGLIAQMSALWEHGQQYAAELGGLGRQRI